MTFQNPPDDKIRELLSQAKTIAVVGLSDKPDRPAYRVAKYLQSAGYRIIPVHPQAEAALGKRAYRSLKEIPEKIDLVDIFVPADRLAPIIEEAIALKLPAVWIQEGIINEEVFENAKSHGLTAVMDRCALKEHRRLIATKNG